MEGHWRLEYGGQGCCQKLPTMHMTAPMTSKGPAPNIKSARLRNPALNHDLVSKVTPNRHTRVEVVIDLNAPSSTLARHGGPCRCLLSDTFIRPGNPSAHRV